MEEERENKEIPPIPNNSKLSYVRKWVYEYPWLSLKWIYSD